MLSALEQLVSSAIFPPRSTAAHFHRDKTADPLRPALAASGSLKGITTKLQLLHSMISTPPPGSPEAESAPKYTPFERLKLLREVTEDARVFRLGGEDKIRVATSTCETVSRIPASCRNDIADLQPLSRSLRTLRTSQPSPRCSSHSFLPTFFLSYHLPPHHTDIPLRPPPARPSLAASNSTTPHLAMPELARPLACKALSAWSASIGI